MEGPKERWRKTSSSVIARAALAAQVAASSNGTSRMYPRTAEEPQRPSSWMAQTSKPALARPWAPVTRKEWPLIRADWSGATKGTPSRRAASIVSVPALRRGLVARLRIPLSVRFLLSVSEPNHRDVAAAGPHGAPLAIPRELGA